jgi:signal transduction histidine kinase
VKPRLLVIFLLIVLAPLALVGWLGVRVSRAEQQMVSLRFREVLTGRLRDADAVVAGVLAAKQRQLQSQPVFSGRPADEIRQLARTLPFVRQLFVLANDGRLAYPSAAGPNTEAETEFIARTRPIWANGEIPHAAPRMDSAVPLPGTKVIDSKQNGSITVGWLPSYTKSGGEPKNSLAAPAGNSWHSWYSGSGIDIIFWWRDDAGVTVGAEMNLSALMADIIAALAQTGSDAALPNARIALRDSNGGVIHQWGGYEPGKTARPEATLALSPPLSAWTLSYYLPPSDLPGGYGRGVALNILLGVFTLMVAVAALAFYYYRENAREMREAAQRISFVNQVSHELKTPLTSIRMYAELLEDTLQESDEKPAQYLKVIVAESQRLSRLIGNILTFSRKQRSKLALHPVPADINEVLQSVIETFRAALEARDVAIEFESAADGDALLDRDVVEQIIGNLLGNVEKYAASGKRVTVRAARTGETLSVWVADEGPGIPPRERRRIFTPFYRVSNRLTDGVAGTGIGLSIARDLARLHGGDLVLDDAKQGACFRVTLRAPRANGEEAT